MDLKASFNHMMLVELRQKEGIKRLELAERLGVSASYIAKIENGRRIPGRKVLCALSRIAGVPMEEFVANDGESETACSAEAAGDMMKVLDDLKRERHTVKTMGIRIAELKRQ